MSAGATDLEGLLHELGFDLSIAGLAVARNGEVVPRAGWPAMPLAPGDEIDIVGAVQGG